MSYTLSFDASPEAKCQRSEVRGYLRHQARDLDKQNGTEVRHSNELIDPAKTLGNRSLVYDRRLGRLRTAKSVDEVEAAIQERLGDVTGRVQANSVAVRGLLVELDPGWYKDHPGEKPTEAVVAWLQHKFGIENIVGVFEHVDETSPHYHVAFVPVTKDGRLSQKDFFPNPGEMRKMHDEFRDFMIEKGYDIEKRRQPKRQHMTTQEYKDWKNAKEVADELQAEREAAAADREAAAADRAEAERIDAQIGLLGLKADAKRQLKEREAALKGREEAVTAREAEVARRAAEIEQARQKAVETALEAFQARVDEIAEKYLEEPLEASRPLPGAVYAILQDPERLGYRTRDGQTISAYAAAESMAKHDTARRMKRQSDKAAETGRKKIQRSLADLPDCSDGQQAGSELER